jgi:hypothetical protein
MNWRTVVLRYAANVLDEIGKHDLADELRDVDVPIYDGGGMAVARYNGGAQIELLRWSLLSGEYEPVDYLSVQQNFDVDGTIDAKAFFLAPIYPHAVKGVTQKCCNRCA